VNPVSATPACSLGLERKRQRLISSACSLRSSHFVAHVLLPCFVLAGRLDVVETVGTVIAEVLDGPSGVRPAQPAMVPFDRVRRPAVSPRPIPVWSMRGFQRYGRGPESFGVHALPTPRRKGPCDATTLNYRSCHPGGKRWSPGWSSTSTSFGDEVQVPSSRAQTNIWQSFGFS
jgi:hypothetical protein